MPIKGRKSAASSPQFRRNFAANLRIFAAFLPHCCAVSAHALRILGIFLRIFGHLYGKFAALWLTCDTCAIVWVSSCPMCSVTCEHVSSCCSCWLGEGSLIWVWYPTPFPLSPNPSPTESDWRVISQCDTRMRLILILNSYSDSNWSQPQHFLGKEYKHVGKANFIFVHFYM